MKLMLIGNPAAGNFRLKRRWTDEIHPFLKKTLGDFDCRFTEKPGDATHFARQALREGRELIVSMGGDGTVNEVVNGFFDGGTIINNRASLGILPFGSGGDFIRTLGWPRDYRKLARRLTSKDKRKIDVGLVEFADPDIPPRYFINTAQVGCGAAIMQRVNGKSKALPSFLRYVTGSFQGFMDYHNTPVRLMIYPHGSFVVNLTNLIIANGRFFGHNMCPAPQAQVDDGLFDVVVIKNMGLKHFMVLFPQLYLKKKWKLPRYWESFKSDKISIEILNPTQDLETEVDGENCGSGNQTFTILPGAINLKV